jgi:hypothetical protein
VEASGAAFDAVLGDHEDSRVNIANRLVGLPILNVADPLPQRSIVGALCLYGQD